MSHTTQITNPRCVHSDGRFRQRQSLGPIVGTLIDPEMDVRHCAICSAPILIQKFLLDHCQERLMFAPTICLPCHSAGLYAGISS